MMKRGYLLVSFAWIALFSWSNTSHAEDRDSLVVNLGEAFGPSNVRLTLNSIDVGFDGKGAGVYVGKRLWKGNAYGGTGIWVGFDDAPGIYGVIGKDWIFFKALLTSFEFYSVGTVSGKTYAVAHLGVGISW